jgi:hypothetical protein
MAVPEISPDRSVRAAKNQALFRGANDRVKELNEAFSLVSPLGEWICECANVGCIERIEMSLDAYEAVRLYEKRFFIAPSDEHFWPDVERVIEQTDGYWVVELTVQESEAERDDAPSECLPLSLRT